MTTTTTTTPTYITALGTLTDPMTDFAARLKAGREFGAELKNLDVATRRGLGAEIRDRQREALLDLRAGYRPADDLEGLSIALEAIRYA